MDIPSPDMHRDSSLIWRRNVTGLPLNGELVVWRCHSGLLTFVGCGYLKHPTLLLFLHFGIPNWLFHCFSEFSFVISMVYTCALFSEEG